MPKNNHTVISMQEIEAMKVHIDATQSDIEKLEKEKLYLLDAINAKSLEKDTPTLWRYFGESLDFDTKLEINGKVNSNDKQYEKILENINLQCELLRKTVEVEKVAVIEAERGLSYSTFDSIRNNASREHFDIITQTYNQFNQWKDKAFGIEAFDNKLLKHKEIEKRKNLQIIDRNCKRIRRKQERFNTLYRREVNKARFKLKVANALEKTFLKMDGRDEKQLDFKLTSEKTEMLNELQAKINSLCEHNMRLVNANKKLSEEQLEIQEKYGGTLTNWKDKFDYIDKTQLERDLANPNHKLNIIASEKGVDIEAYKESYSPAQIHQIVRAIADYKLPKDEVEMFIDSEMPADKMATAFSMAYQQHSIESLDKYFAGKTPKELAQSIMATEKSVLYDASMEKKCNIENATLDEVLGAKLAEEVNISSNIATELSEVNTNTVTQEQIAKDSVPNNAEISEIITEMQKDGDVFSITFKGTKEEFQKVEALFNNFMNAIPDEPELQEALKKTLEVSGLDEFKKDNTKFPEVTMIIPSEQIADFNKFQSELFEKEQQQIHDEKNFVRTPSKDDDFCR